jgi:hypothetical protein
MDPRINNAQPHFLVASDVIPRPGGTIRHTAPTAAAGRVMIAKDFPTLHTP